MKISKLSLIHLSLGTVLGIIGACSPTKFNVNPPNYCVSADQTCIIENGVTKVTQNFKVGSGKVDILFVDDNSASMYDVQSKLAARFSGFIEDLNRRGVDYQIGITTTDLNFSKGGGLLTFGNTGKKVLSNSVTNKVQLFNSTIVRQETLACENFIKSSYYTYGPSFRSSYEYASQYANYCTSEDERGIYSAFEVISNNSNSILRPDANLNIIVVSNEDVRSGMYKEGSLALEANDKATNFIDMMNQKYPDKYWEFHSIITKDNNCIQNGQNSFTDKNGNVIVDDQGYPVIIPNIGSEYASISSSASKNVDGSAAPRGQVLDICSDDYASYFSNIAAKISDSSRLLTLSCKPMEAPSITNSNGAVISVPYSWNGDTQIVFQKGSEGIDLKINYKCYSGVK